MLNPLLNILWGHNNSLTFASLSVGYGLSHVPVESLLAVVAVSSCRGVAALEADATADSPAQLVQFHVEPASPRMTIAVAGCNRGNNNSILRTAENSTEQKTT